ncbi:MAG: hypothetical protein KIT69_10805, partial [Propionibacteriaceae bacterium]|nr:hypothetical protein [Propionibacteriaceae bacterium]
AGLRPALGGSQQHHGGEPLGMAMACMFLLLIAMVTLNPPPLATSGWRPSHVRAVLSASMAPTPQAPSLHVLCISRT